MKTGLSRFLFTILFGLVLLAGCAAKDVQMRTEDGSTSARGRDQVNTEPKSNPSLNRREAKVQARTNRPISVIVQGAEAGHNSELRELINVKQYVLKRITATAKRPY